MFKGSFHVVDIVGLEGTELLLVIRAVGRVHVGAISIAHSAIDYRGKSTQHMACWY